jgi:hypothetical protein
MMVVLTIVIIALIATLPKNGAENQTLSNHINNQSGPHARPSYTIALFNRSQLNATGMCINSDIGTNGIKTVCKVNQNASGFKLLSVRYDMAQLLVYNTCVKDANNTALSECGVENISTGPLPSLYCISNKSLVFDWTNLINNTAGFIIYNGPCSLPFNTG